MKTIFIVLFTMIGNACYAEDKILEGNTILLIEDNYLMVEFMPSKNLKYAKKELDRISKFGKEHFEGTGYSDATEITQKPIATIESKISKKDVIILLESVGLTRYPKLMYFGFNGFTEVTSSKTIVYGSLESGIFLDVEGSLIKNIWFDSQNWKEINKTKIADGFKILAEKYDLILIDWTNEKIIDLNNDSEIKKYLTNSN